MQVITSNQNSIFKEAKSLKQKKFREENRKYLIEGKRFVEEAIKEKIKVESFFFSDKIYKVSGGSQLIEKIDTGTNRIYEVSDKLLEEICDTENPQGIVAVIPMENYSLDSVILENKSYVILEGIQDPGNMGTIIRTADAAGFDGIIALKGCVDIYNPKVLRSTMGSIFHIPIVLGVNNLDVFEALKKHNLKTFATHLNGKCSYFDAPMSKGGAILIGNEANGLCEETSNMADVLVKIPMPGRAESLNASTAAALMMYEMLRQKV